MKYNDADGRDEREEQSAKTSRIKNVSAAHSFMRARKYSDREKKGKQEKIIIII